MGRSPPGLIRFGLRRAANTLFQAFEVTKTARARLNAQKPALLWFTGLSGAGKSTIADHLEKKLHALGKHTFVLDGDNVRHGLNRDLGFTEGDRVENIRRVAEVSKLFVEAGLITLVAFISPFRAEREMARELVAPGEFIEIFVDTPLAACEERDPKGLYKKARRGELQNFTGLDSPYEPPLNPELTLDALNENPTISPTASSISCSGAACCLEPCSSSKQVLLMTARLPASGGSGSAKTGNPFWLGSTMRASPKRRSRCNGSSGGERLDGLSFLDIGSGSGLSSLAARRLGASVVSFDYDPQSVECTTMLRDRYFPADPNWRVERGSILDRDYLNRLGHFEIVYSWGVLHHTGAMR